jgi:hypothetical protein
MEALRDSCAGYAGQLAAVQIAGAICDLVFG